MVCRNITVLTVDDKSSLCAKKLLYLSWCRQVKQRIVICENDFLSWFNLIKEMRDVASGMKCVSKCGKMCKRIGLLRFSFVSKSFRLSLAILATACFSLPQKASAKRVFDKHVWKQSMLVSNVKEVGRE